MPFEFGDRDAVHLGECALGAGHEGDDGKVEVHVGGEAAAGASELGEIVSAVLAFGAGEIESWSAFGHKIDTDLLQIWLLPRCGRSPGI